MRLKHLRAPLAWFRAISFPRDGDWDTESVNIRHIGTIPPVCSPIVNAKYRAKRKTNSQMATQVLNCYRHRTDWSRSLMRGFSIIAAVT
jgi:hypothetical protein